MASTYRMVSYGSTGSAVRELQEALNRHGYELDVDGIFGDKTRAAVRSYQQRNDLKLDGIAGDETWGSLMGNTAAESAQTPAAPAVSAATAAALEKLEQGYTPSADNEALYDYADSLAALQPQGYTSAFEAQLSALYDQLASREDFSYDPKEDAAFAGYLARFTREGKAAMDDTLAKSAHLTGGYGSSYAQSAAQQAYQQYLGGLGDVLPALQEAAYQRYLDDGAALLEQMGILQSRDEAAYERYLDAVKSWRSDYESARESAENDRAAEEKQYKLLLDYFSDKAKAEAKGETVTATAPAVESTASLSSTGVESLLRAMTNYLKKRDTASAKALYQRYDKRFTPAQRSRMRALLGNYGVMI